MGTLRLCGGYKEPVELALITLALNPYLVYFLTIMHKINQRKPSKICTLCNVERLETAFADKNYLLFIYFLLCKK